MSYLENAFGVTGQLWGKPQVTGGVLSERAGKVGFDDFFDVCLDKWLNKPSSCRWFVTMIWDWDYGTHYSDVIIGTMASQITSLAVVYSTVYSAADQRKHQSSASLAFVRGILRTPVNSPHKGSVTRKMFPFDDVIIHFDVSVMYAMKTSVSFHGKPLNELVHINMDIHGPCLLSKSLW